MIYKVYSVILDEWVELFPIEGASEQLTLNNQKRWRDTCNSLKIGDVTYIHQGFIWLSEDSLLRSIQSHYRNNKFILLEFAFSQEQLEEYLRECPEEWTHELKGFKVFDSLMKRDAAR